MQGLRLLQRQRGRSRSQAARRRRQRRRRQQQQQRRRRRWRQQKPPRCRRISSSRRRRRRSSTGSRRHEFWSACARRRRRRRRCALAPPCRSPADLARVDAGQVQFCSPRGCPQLQLRALDHRPSGGLRPGRLLAAAHSERRLGRRCHHGLRRGTRACGAQSILRT